MEEPLFSSRQHSRMISPNHGFHHPLVPLVFLLLCLQSSTGQLISFYPSGSQYVTDTRGVVTLVSSLTHSLVLHGYNLTNTTLLKWTESNTDCDESRSLFGTTTSEDTTLLKNDVFKTIFTVTFPLISTPKTLYFCIRYEDSDTYSHQGQELLMIVSPPTSSLFPLPVTILFIIILMCLSGLFSGLNLGLMALDPTTLKIIEKSGSKRQKKYAKVIYRVRRFGNYLLCTLLLGNVLVNSTFTILLDSVIGSGVYAVIGSTLAIVIFGEIVPQAICSRYGLMIGAYTIWLTYIFMVLTFPLALPISLLLNLILGKEIGAVYNRQQLLELLNVTKEDADINDYELGILSGALKFKDKTVAQIMTRYEHVFCVSIDSILDFQTIKEIYDSGFSRMPIYEEDRNNIVGILHVRDLTFIDPEDCIPVRQLKEFYNRPPSFVFDDTTLEKQLTSFVETGCHIAIVHCVVESEGTDNEYQVIGVITLEDIIEEIIGREIVDEYDQFEDNVTHKKRKRQIDGRHVDVAQVMYTTPVISLSAQQRLAASQFLSSVVEPFHEKYITKSVLNQLLQQDIVFKLTREDSTYLLYQPQVSANYFTLLLEGCLHVTIGEEQLQFEARGFYSFGANSLFDTTIDYLPDFKVTIAADCLVVIVTRRRYQAAVRASRFEREHSDTTLNRHDVFCKEWETAETGDLQAGLAGTDGLTNITHLLKTKPLQGFELHLNSGYTSSSAMSPLEEGEGEGERREGEGEGRGERTRDGEDYSINYSLPFRTSPNKESSV